MKLLVFLSALCAVHARFAHQPIEVDYHNKIGIPRATQLKAAEAARDFDGSRIIGGAVVPLGSHPYLAGIIVNLNTGQTSWCGACLLSNTRLVTAAHCWLTERAWGRSMTVALGSLDLFSGGLRVAATEVELHNYYNMWNLNNDVGIITIPWVSYTNSVNRILLPSGAQLTNNYVGQNLLVAGYGLISDNTAITNTVQREATLTVITNNECAWVYGTNTVIPSTLCTSGAQGRAICDGDSGGPLVLVSGGQRYLIGVISFRAVAGCESGLPSGFSRVSSFINWINARV